MGMAKEMDTIERRDCRRIQFREPVQYQYKDPSQFGGWLACDISEGGIKVNMNDFVPLDTEISLQVPLANGKTIDCLGRVVWVQKLPFSDYYQAGLKFEVVDSIVEVQNDLHQYIESF